MEEYIKNFNNFEETFIYDFKSDEGGIGDFIKFFMLILDKCIKNNVKLYHKVNNIEIEKYIKFKYDFFNITSSEISKLKNVSIKTPHHYYREIRATPGIAWVGSMQLVSMSPILVNEVFFFDDAVKLNVKNIFPDVPSNYISIHLRLGDKFLEIDQRYVPSKNDTRQYSEEKIYNFIENNNNENIIFFCDNNSYKLKIKEKYKNIFITNASIGHTALSNTTPKQILDAITEFYLLTKSQSIYAASRSGFSKLASKFNDIEYIT